MAFRASLTKCSGSGTDLISVRRWASSMAHSAPLQNSFDIAPPQLALPEHENNDGVYGDLPNFDGGFMDLMAVPRRKTTPHKKKIRNAPKALKPVPVIVRCTVCGRVRLPHFFCCSGIRQNPGGQSD